MYVPNFSYCILEFCGRYSGIVNAPLRSGRRNCEGMVSLVTVSGQNIAVKENIVTHPGQGSKVPYYDVQNLAWR
jgi:hypothetical protein